MTRSADRADRGANVRYFQPRPRREVVREDLERQVVDRSRRRGTAAQRQEAVRRVDERGAAAAQRPRQADLLPQHLGPARRRRRRAVDGVAERPREAGDVPRSTRAGAGRGRR